MISYVDAFELKQEEMVKLPVLAYNLRDKSEVIHKAVEIREHLEAHAKEEQKVSKRYVRPIVLFQAEPRNREDVVDYV